MTALLSNLLLVYVVALHVSMAAMEATGWLIVVLVVGYKFYRREKFAFHGLLWPAMALLFCIGVSLLWTRLEKPFLDQFGFFRFVFLLMGLVWALEMVWSKAFERRLIWIWSGVLLLSGAYASFQALTGVDLIPRSRPILFDMGGVWKATGFFSFSLTFAYMSGLSFWSLSRPAFHLLGRVGVVACAFGGLGLLAAMSRGAWLAGIACGLTYIVFARRKLLLPFFMSVLVGGVTLSILSSGFADKIQGLIEFKMDHSASVRVDLWRAYGQMFLDHPVFGVGIFEGDKLLPAYYERLGIHQDFTSHAHNIFLQVLAGAGVLAFVAFLWLLFVPIKAAWRMRARTVWGWSLFLAQLFLLLGGLTEANFFDGEVNHFLMFIWALTMTLYSFFGDREVQYQRV